MGHRLVDMAEGARGVAIAGPTASGKSALALDLAVRANGWVINADSMQIYRDLRILTARPSPADEAAAPHLLYGHVDGAEDASAARWATEARGAIEAAREAGALPILVGGTGLYFRSLFSGLAPVPHVPPEIRAHFRARGGAEPAAALHADLARVDPAMAARLNPSDTQRIVRALEVMTATGRSLGAWQADPMTPLESPEGWVRVVLDPPRDALAARADRRVHAMVAEGAVAEVAALMARGLPPTLPVMKAIGVAQLGAHIQGGDLAEAVAAMQAATRRYIKRQQTWFRTQMPDWTRLA